MSSQPKRTLLDSAYGEGTVELIYIGRRLLGEKVMQAFTIVGTKEERYWQGIKWLIVGHKYEGLRKGEHITMKVNPTDLGPDESITEATREIWDTKELLVREFIVKRRASKEAARRVDKLGEDLRKLKQMVRGLNYHEQYEFVNALTAKLRRMK